MVEVAMALGLVVFCLLALVGVLSVGLSGNRDGMQQTRAAHLLGGVLKVRREFPLADHPATANLPIGPLHVATGGYVTNSVYASGETGGEDFVFVHKVVPNPVGRSSTVHAWVGWPLQAPSVTFEAVTEILWP